MRQAITGKTNLVALFAVCFLLASGCSDKPEQVKRTQASPATQPKESAASPRYQSFLAKIVPGGGDVANGLAAKSYWSVVKQENAEELHFARYQGDAGKSMLVTPASLASDASRTIDNQLLLMFKNKGLLGYAEAEYSITNGSNSGETGKSVASAVSEAFAATLSPVMPAPNSIQVKYYLRTYPVQYLPTGDSSTSTQATATADASQKPGLKFTASGDAGASIYRIEARGLSVEISTMGQGGEAFGKCAEAISKKLKNEIDDYEAHRVMNSTVEPQATADEIPSRKTNKAVKIAGHVVAPDGIKVPLSKF